ncbi:MAG: hypothetical protein IT196_14655 [Acidimicrobiales bacterium]|nr:hypothetical protein [Acidimicrobiales bacterium]
MPPPPPPGGGAAFLPPPPYLPPPPALTTDGPAPTKGSRTSVLLVALVAVIGLVCAAGFVLTRQGGEEGPTYPDVWDPRVTELVAFVERERGLPFKHPVYVDFLPAEDIARRMRSEAGAVNGAMREAAALQVSELRALGLVSGDVDLLASAGSLSAEGVVAFYDPVAERITAPDGELDARQRSILVHELTHVLQDQHFELDELQRKAPAPDTLRALAEGDAGRIEAKYVASLPPEEQLTVNTRNNDESDAYKEATADIPPALDAFQAAPYVLGEGMVNTLADFGGQETIDASFQHPPVSDEALIDPSHYRGNGSVRAVQPPTVVAGETLLDQGTLGPLMLYLVLANSTDTATAIKGAYGWGGDAYAMVRNGDQTCMRITYQGDTADDLREMQAALTVWASAAPGVRREVAQIGPQLQIVACDPGPDVAIPLAGNPSDSLLVPRTVMELSVQLHAEGMAYGQARCVGVEFVSQYALVELTELLRSPAWSPEQQAARDARFTAAAARC